MNDENPEERKLALDMNMVILERCDEVWVFGYKITEGMEQEIKQAKKLGKVIRFRMGVGSK